MVAGGEALLAPSVTRRLIADLARLPREGRLPAPALDGLTPRETGVLRLIARGLSDTETSDALVIAQQTAKTCVGRILAKPGPRDPAQAVVVAYESGLVPPGSSWPELRRGSVLFRTVPMAGTQLARQRPHGGCTASGLGVSATTAPRPVQGAAPVPGDP